MLQASELRNSATFVYRNEPWRVIEYKHTHMGRGSADVRVRIRGLISGIVKSETFAPDDRFEEAMITKQPYQYLYREGEELVFMHPVTFEQVRVKVETVGEDRIAFLKEGEEIGVLFWDEAPLDVEIPPKVVLAVAECDPGVKGNSATNIYKPAKLENGLVIKVPLFVKVGDKVRVDTRDANYVERVG